VYLYESFSYRDEQGRPRSKRQIAGKLDKDNKPVYNARYLASLEERGLPMPPKDAYCVEEIRSSSLKQAGLFYFFSKIAETTGLFSVLQEAFPDNWADIFDLSCFLASSGEPMMYCEDWLEKTDAFPARLSSQDIRALLQKLGGEGQDAFFRLWGKRRCEREYLALDITSISSYSQFILDVEHGYNRDGERLPQVNLCMLLGEKSHLPVFQIEYSGSLKDVSTLETTLETIYRISGSKLRLVMDKGFYSLKNLKTMLKGHKKNRFLISVPFTSGLAKKAVARSKANAENPENAIAWEKQSIQGFTYREDLMGKNLYVHVYYNMVKAAETKSSLHAFVGNLRAHAMKYPDDSKHKGLYDRYLSIVKEKKTGKPRVGINKEAAALEYRYAGWMVIASNCCASAEKAIELYRLKDVVEKGFYRLKNCLDTNRLRVHSDTAVRGKMIISFIALILQSSVHNGMTMKNMYKGMTMKELFRQLEKLLAQYICGNRMLYPVTKTQRTIFDAFGFAPPV
jgi:transposase